MFHLLVFAWAFALALTGILFYHKGYKALTPVQRTSGRLIQPWSVAIFIDVALAVAFFGWLSAGPELLVAWPSRIAMLIGALLAGAAILVRSDQMDRHGDNDFVTVALSLLPALIIIVAATIGIGLFSAEIFQADKYASRIQVDAGTAAAIPPADIKHIRLVPAESALNQMRAGLTGSLGSQFQVCDETLSLVSQNGELRWIAVLDYSDHAGLTGWWRNRGNGTPGYMTISAEKPGDKVKLTTAGADGKPFAIKYTPGALFGDNLKRRIKAAVSDYRQGPPIFTIDDAGRPHYVVTMTQPQAGNGADKPVAFVVIDPQSGAVASHLPGQTPAWVKVGLNEALVVDMLNNNQTYQGRSWWNSKMAGWKGSLKVSHDNLWLVLQGDKLGWFGTMTSLSSKDNTVTSGVFVDALTGKAELYQSIIGHDAYGITANIKATMPTEAQKWTVTDPIAYQINGRNIWVAPVVDSTTYGYQGVGVALADSSNTAAHGSTIEAALARLELRASETSGGTVSASAAGRTFVGVISHLGDIVERGDKTFRFRIKGLATPLQTSGVSDETSDIALARIGSSVSVDWLDSGSGKFATATKVTLK